MSLAVLSWELESQFPHLPINVISLSAHLANRRCLAGCAERTRQMGRVPGWAPSAGRKGDSLQPIFDSSSLLGRRAQLPLRTVMPCEDCEENLKNAGSVLVHPCPWVDLRNSGYFRGQKFPKRVTV